MITVGRRAALAVGLTTVTTLVGLSLVSGYHLAAAQSRARTADRIATGSADLLAALLNAETGQRGYLLTGDPQYLMPYEDGAATARGDVRRLEADARSVPAVTARLPAVRGLTQRKLGELDTTISLARAGREDEALSIVRGNTGQQLMDQLRQELDTMRTASLGLARSSQDVATRSLTVLSVTVVVLLVGSSVLVGVILPLQARSRRWQQTSEASRAESAASEARFRLSFQEAPLAMALTGLDPQDPGRCLMVNSALSDLTGYSQGQLLGMRMHELTHPQDQPPDVDLFQEMVTGRRLRYQRDQRLVRADGTTRWVRMFASRVTSPQGDEYAVAHLEDITERMAAEQMARDALSTLQGALLPRVVSSVAGVTVAARYRSAATTHDLIGGDWYDTIALPDGGLGLVIGDVEGHDMTAATVMGLVRGAVRGAALEGFPPAVIVERVNAFLLSSGIERLVTMAYVHLYPNDRTATVALGGHPQPLVVSPFGRRVSALDVPYGLALNLQASGDWTERTVLLPSGAHLVLYTDGLIDSSHASGHDLDDVVAALTTGRDGSLDPAGEIADTMIAVAPSYDDVAVLVARVSAPHSPVAARTFPTLPMSAGMARGWITDMFTIWRDLEMLPGDTDTEDRLGTSQLLVTELVSNAVRHSDRPVTARLELTAEHLKVSVWDSSERMPVLRGLELTAAEGRGLRLVDALSSRWGVDLASDGKVVWFELGLTGPTEIDEDALLSAFADL